MENVSEKVNHILVDKIGIPASEITPDANFIKDLGIDSLDYAELVMEFEQTFNIRIPDDKAEELKTVKNAVDFIENEIKTQHVH
jgi:acyl carrier protein